MNLVKVNSSNVEAIGYENNTLYIKYPSGLYAYSNVPMNILIELMNASSIGQYINANIKNKYNYTKVG